MEFSDQDIQQIKSNNLTVNAVKQQLKLFKNGVPFINLKEIATINNGILKLNKTDIDFYCNLYQSKKNALDIVKFVPASGAATRMFKFLFQFLEDFNPKKQTIKSFLNKNKDTNISVFIKNLEKFPFYNTLLNSTKTYYPNYNTLSKDQQIIAYIKTLLDKDKLNYAQLPKGLLPFHKYKKRIVTAFEEHLLEAALYAESNKTVTLHFTVSKQHETRFKKEFFRIQSKIEQKTGVRFLISFSQQQSSTDTIAATLDNKPFKLANGNLLFRPSGHGALLKNLNSINADFVFIKNIDNVVVSKHQQEIANYKQALGGFLIKIQEQTFKHLNRLDEANVKDLAIIEILTFLSQKLNVIINPEFKTYPKKKKIEYLQKQLNKPIRICGMVKNKGESGGGPFWVNHKNGAISLQIVEASQIDLKDKQQRQLAKKATHFNPVDIVCGLKNYKGKLFKLQNYVDYNTAFTTTKYIENQSVKVLELPGLWNGSMANWNTIFVEVPLQTFNPVKTVNDLLKIPHQAI